MPNSSYRLLSEEDLSTAGTWLSACEQKAAKAERQIQAIKKARFMNKMLGQSFTGLVSSVTKFGLFVLLREFNIDGLIRLDDLGQDKWEFDEENLSLTAKRSGYSYNMGDTLQVCVSLVDIEQGQINFVIDGETPNKEKASSKVKDKDKNKTKRSEKEILREKKERKAKSKVPVVMKKSLPSNKSDTNKTSPSNFSPSTPQTYQPKPRYASLADYLDKKKGTANEEKSESKRPSGSFKNRSNTEKRSQTENDSGGIRKARFKKFSRKNKSR